MTSPSTTPPAFDVGPQTPAGITFGTDDRPDRCVRCQEGEPVSGGDFCAACAEELT